MGFLGLVQDLVGKCRLVGWISRGAVSSVCASVCDCNRVEMQTVRPM